MPCFYQKGMLVKLIWFALCVSLLQAADPAVYVRELNQIRSLLDAGDFRTALAEAKKLNQRAPDEMIGYQLIATSELALGLYSEAEKSIQWMLDLKIGKADSSGWLLVAQFREATGDYDGALEAVNQSFTRLVQGQDAEARKLLSYSARLQLLAGKLTRAEAAATEALKTVAAGDTSATETLARVRLAQKRPEEALLMLRERSAVNPNPRLLYLIAEASESQADYAAFEKAALRDTLKPDQANRELVMYLAGKGARPAQALQIARKEAERKGDVYTQDALALALFANGETAAAQKLMKAVLAVGTQDPEILAHAARVGVKAE